MDTNQTVVIYTTTNPVEAQVLRNTLEEEGIRCQLDSENQAGWVGLENIRLLVHAGDVEKAKELVLAHDEHRELAPTTEE